MEDRRLGLGFLYQDYSRLCRIVIVMTSTNIRILGRLEEHMLSKNVGATAMY